MKNKWWAVAKAVWTVFNLLKRSKNERKINEVVEVVDAVIKAQESK